MADDESNSINLAFETLQKEHDSEESRNKHLETKAQIMLALCGILISANMFLLKVTLENSTLLIIKLSLTLIIISLITYAIYELLSVLKIREFEKINHDALTLKSVQYLPESELKSKLIIDYNDCITKSFNVLKDKSRSIKYGSNLIEVAAILFCILLFIVVITSYIERTESMSEKSSTAANQSTTQNSNSSTTISTNTNQKPITESSNSTNKGEGLGTITVERGHKK